MAAGNFAACCAFSLLQEGGFCDVQGDPGGATNHGVTIGELSAVLGRSATIADVAALSPAQAQAIYQPRYWVPVGGDGLSAGVDLVMFDFGINAGPGASVRILQRVVNVAADGVMGRVSLAAAAGIGAGDLVGRLSEQHIAFYEGLRGYAQFGAGWVARALRARAAGMGMVG